MLQISKGEVSKRGKIMDALEAALNKLDLKHIDFGIGTDKLAPSGRLIGMIYIDRPEGDLPADVMSKLPTEVSIKDWFRSISVPVQFRNIGVIELQ